MIEKMSLEQFQQIRNQLTQLLKEYEDNYEAHKNDENYDDSVEEQRLVAQYLEIQNRLLQYDLSDIPYEAWNAFYIISYDGYIPDFSRTKANIDFSLIQFYGYVNFRGCNVRNLEECQYPNTCIFDENIINNNSSLFLSNIFTKEFKEKFDRNELTINDLVNLSSQQIEEIKKKNFSSHIYEKRKLIEIIGIDKSIEFYNYSPKDYSSVAELVEMWLMPNNDNTNLPTIDEFIKKIKSDDVEVKDLKNMFFAYERKVITNSSTPFSLHLFPESFKNENSDIFLVGANIPDEVKKRYFERKLKIQDLLDYPEVFSNFPVDYFMADEANILQFVRDNYGMGKFQELVKKYPDVFTHISQENEFDKFGRFLKEGNDLDRTFKSAVKEYFFEYGMPEHFIDVSEGQTIYNVPYWLSSMNFQFVDKLKTNEDLLKYNDSIYVIDSSQRHILDMLGIDNIRRFEEETGFFTHKESNESINLEIFNLFVDYFEVPAFRSPRAHGIDFKNGGLSYEDFLDQLANCLECMRKDFKFSNHPTYDFIRGKFRENHPEIFMDLNAPDELKKAFYENKINPGLLFQHMDYVKYLADKDLTNSFADIRLIVPGLTGSQERNFVEEYVSRYGNEKFLQLCVKYGTILSNIDVISLHGEIEDEKAVEKSLRSAIYSKINLCKNTINYSYLANVPEFATEHPEIFVDFDDLTSISEEERKRLTAAFYSGDLKFDDIKKYPELVGVLKNKNLENHRNLANYFANIRLIVPGLTDNQEPRTLNFVEEYVSRYGNEKFLQLCVKYGAILSNIDVISLHGEIEDEKAVEKSLRNAICNKIVNGQTDNYSYLANVPEFVTEHPKIFVDFDSLTSISEEERKRLTAAFYSGDLKFDDIKKYPELVGVLKNKNLLIAFKNIVCSDQLLQVFGNEKFLQLCTKYGRYMNAIEQGLSDDLATRKGKQIFDQHMTDFEEITKKTESIIARECKLGNFAYNPDDAPDFLKENYPELFLPADAPEELKKYFYNYFNEYTMSFEVLQRNKDWMPFLKGKAITTALLRIYYLKPDIIKLLEVFGEDKANRLVISRAETVYEMIKAKQVDLMKSWFDKTGGKFIPDFVVMQNFSLEEADKFLASGKEWSKLMRIQSFSRIPEARDAMLKLAYSFGAFDQDQRGFKKLQDLLTGLPKKIDPQHENIIELIDHQIDQYSKRGHFYHNVAKTDINGNHTIKSPSMTSEEKEEAYNKMIEHVKKNKFVDFIDTATLVNLLETLKEEKVDVDFSKPIFAQIYRKNEDGSYSLTINTQSCQKSAQAIRCILEKFRELPILTPVKAQTYFRNFKLEYDPDFREFFLANFDAIISNPTNLSQISEIQRRFKEIKTVYSNVSLTLKLAISYIDNNKYENVNTGNERVVKAAAIQNYSQQDFEILQQIYNYGKQRTFSSIPRISSDVGVSLTSGIYHYEILRLDDPKAMSIGFESDCCQKLNDPAELCMEHSMVDKNGRVFVITNETGEVVAQSWVWRNKDVLCFDNIEVPDKKMWENGIEKGEEESGIRNQFTDDILTIYKMAAHDLIESDEKVYRELLESGKITQEQYDGLRLGKITAGVGYSNIKGSLYTLPIDKENLSRPLPFEEPVKLSRELYIRDSTTQYVLEERDDRKQFDGETLPVHSDTYVEYNDENFSEKSLFSLEKLEIVTKEDPMQLKISIDNYVDPKHLVTKLAKNYDLNPETTRIIMNPNFAIIYDVNGDNLKIGDLLFNTRVDNGKQQMDIENQVIMQIRLGLNQIASDKKIDISSLDEKQKEMYAKVTGLTDEMDIERGVGHAR